MSPNRSDIREYVVSIFQTYNTPSIVKVIPDTGLAFVRKLLFYLWFVDYISPQSGKSKIRRIRRDDLFRFIGATSSSTVDFELTQGELSTWIKPTANGEAYELNERDIMLIESLLDEHYGVKKLVPYLNKPAHEFIRQIYQYPDNPQLFQDIIAAFRRAFNPPNVLRPLLEITAPFAQDSSGIALIRTVEDFYALIGVFATNGALKADDNRMNWDAVRITTQIAETRWDQQEAIGRSNEVFKTLVIAPDAANTKASRHMIAAANIYHIRPIELIYFFFEIDRIVRSGQSTHQQLVERIDTMFPRRPMWNFNVEYALQMLRGETWIEYPPEEGYIIPIIYNSSINQGVISNIEFGFDLDTGHIKLDPEFLVPSEDRRTLVINGKLYSYVVQAVDLGINANARPRGLGYCALNDMTNTDNSISNLKLFDHEIRLVHAAALVASFMVTAR